MEFIRIYSIIEKMPPKGKKSKAEEENLKKRDIKKQESETGSKNSEAEEEDDGEEKSENIDLKFRVNKAVNVYVTLPSGDEEIILNYDMCFCDKVAYQNYKDNGQTGYKTGFGELSQLNT